MKKFFSIARKVFFAGFCVRWLFDVFDVGYWAWVFVLLVPNRGDYSWGPLMLWAVWEFCRRIYDLLFQFCSKKWKEVPENVRQIMEKMQDILFDAKGHMRNTRSGDKFVETKEVVPGILLSLEVFSSSTPSIIELQYQAHIFVRKGKRELGLQIIQGLRRNGIKLSKDGKISVTVIEDDLILFFLRETEHPLCSDKRP